MTPMLLFSHPSRRRSYIRRVLSIEPASLIGFWSMDEAAGAIAYDRSGRGNHGAYTGVTLGQPGPDGRTCPLFDGVGDFVNIHSAGLAADFNGDEGALLLWAKVANAGVWTDAVSRQLFRLRGATDADQIAIIKSTVNNVLNLTYRGQATSKTVTWNSGGNTGWIVFGLTWNVAGDAVKGYVSGIQTGLTQTGVLGWTEVLGSAWIGAAWSTPVNVHSGFLAHVALWSKALTPAQIAYLSVV